MAPEAQAGGPIRVLLADDDDGYVESLRTLIEHQPELTVVGIARDGFQTLELAGECAPDAAVVDLHMPRLDGVATIGRLRRDHPNLCLIALTGDSDHALHEAVERAGADAVVLKGELIGTLLDRLKQRG